MVQLHRLEGFYWVARVGGYARAARAFPYPITQPAVHQQVKKLEQELGVELFERVGKDRMVTTPAGTRLYEFVAPFFERLPSVVRSIEEGDYAGELRIQSAGLMLRHLLPEWVKRIHRKLPEVRVHLTESHSPDLEPLRRGEVDLVVDYFPETPDDVATMQVALVRPFLVMPRTARTPRTAAAAFRKLKGESFISYPPGTLHHDLQLKALAMFSVAPGNIVSATSAEAILGFVEAGLGFSFIPYLDDTGPRIKGVAVLRLESSKIEFPVMTAWRKDTPENPILDAALELAPRV